MASTTPLDMDDEMDEDFFDRLIKDDDDDDYGNVCVASKPSIVKEEDSNDTKALSNLRIREMEPSFDDKEGFKVNDEQCCDSAEVLASVDTHENNVVTRERNSVAGSGVNEANEAGLTQEFTLESRLSGESSTSSGMGVKEVHWPLYSSDIHSHSGDKVKSLSDVFGEAGDDTDDPFAIVAATDNSGSELAKQDEVPGKFVNDFGSSSSGKYLVRNQYHVAESEQNAGGHDLNDSQHWENHYPGWRYEPTTGQWNQLDGHYANISGNANASANGYAQESIDVSAQSGNVVSEQSASTYYSHQSSHSVTGSGTGVFTTDSISNWNQVSHGNGQYPAHMVFDPQYPGWYYDMISQEWRSLESYTPVAKQSTIIGYNQPNQNKSFENGESQVHHSQEHISNLAAASSEKQPPKSQYGATGILNSSDRQTGGEISGSTSSHKQANQNFDNGNGIAGLHSFNSSEQFPQHHNQTKVEPSQNMQLLPGYFDSQKAIVFSEQPFQSDTQFPYVPSEGRSSAGRPPHALVTFGFSGKLIVMKPGSSFHLNSPYESQDSLGVVVNVLNLTEVVMDKTDASNFELGCHDYFIALCQQPLPGPLVGGNVGSKELNKWIDDRISNCDMNYKIGEVLRLLFSLLKISCQYYGKLRSPLGTEQGSKENDRPESAVAKLFASAKRRGMQSGEYGVLMHCLQNFPSESQIQATAVEVQKLLISGQKKEALECAQEGQLWGAALAIATELGDQFYGDTVKNMALKQFIAGSPLQTLCLLMAGNSAAVFSNVATSVGLPGYSDAPQQALQVGAHGMLDAWEDNLSMITANRTKDDELVIVLLGDCLWKGRGEVTAAHMCYLVAEANFEMYSDGARLCLLAADHLKFPRTYASPEAIQRTELYEYSKVLGNSQFLLHSFQPYKLIYAHMLAEVGKVAESLKYCQAILKSLKTGRAPQVEIWRQLVSALEERLRIHQQGGYSANLASKKLADKLLPFFDSTAHRVEGSLPQPVPSPSHSSMKQNEYAQQPEGSRVSNSNSQSTMDVPSVILSASMGPTSAWTRDSQATMPFRSISEPDIGRTPGKADSSKDANSSDTQSKASVPGGSSRFGRFGSQIFQKTVGLVLRSQPHQQAKLGEKNRFYYDEKLKRWVEEGAEPPVEEVALPPPPSTTAFQGTVPYNSIKDAPQIESFHSNGVPEYFSPISSEKGSGIPPIPPSSNQFSARVRSGVRSRYVDTFNKGNRTPATSFQSPSFPTQVCGASNPKFFIPTTVASNEDIVQTTAVGTPEAMLKNESSSIYGQEDSLSSPPQRTPPPSISRHHFPSMGNIVQKKSTDMLDDNNSPPHSR